MISFFLFKSVVWRKTWMTLWSMTTKSLAVFIRSFTKRALERTSIYIGLRFLFFWSLLFIFDFPFTISSFSFYFPLRIVKIWFEILNLILIIIFISKFPYLTKIRVLKLFAITFLFKSYLINFWRIILNLWIQRIMKIVCVISWSCNSSFHCNTIENICLEDI